MNVRFSVALLALAVTAGCSAEDLSSPQSPEPELGVVAGASGCYAVEFESHATGLFPSFSGSVGGDLVGTTDVLFDFANLRFDGATIKNGGVASWSIDGGIVPELTGTTIHMELTAMNVVTPDENKVVGRLRALDGFPALANLTFEGVFNADDSGPPFAVDLVYRGSICP